MRLRNIFLKNKLPYYEKKVDYYVMMMYNGVHDEEGIVLLKCESSGVVVST